MHERRFSADQAHRLDDPARKLWLPPGDVLKALSVRAGATVADVGAGTGYLTLPIAQAVGSTGKVYAVDAQSEMLTLLMQKVAQAGLDNVEPIAAVAEDAGLSASCCDIYLLANVWHELDDCDSAAREAMRALKHGGKVAILDWRPDVEPNAGPPLAHRLSPSHAMEHLRTAGFEAITHAPIGLYSWLVQAETQP